MWSKKGPKRSQKCEKWLIFIVEVYPHSTFNLKIIKNACFDLILIINSYTVECIEKFGSLSFLQQKYNDLEQTMSLVTVNYI